MNELYTQTLNANEQIHSPDAWSNFSTGPWQSTVDVRDFIQRNYTPYQGDASFLAGPTERTQQLWNQVLQLLKAEQEKAGPLDFDNDNPSTITHTRLLL